MQNITSKIWFRRKKYGYGWYPATWQGWVVMFIYIGAIAGWIIWWGNNAVDGNLVVFMFGPIAATLLLLIVCFITGETPRWQWGDDEHKN